MTLTRSHIGDYMGEYYIGFGVQGTRLGVKRRFVLLVGC